MACASCSNKELQEAVQKEKRLEEQQAQDATANQAQFDGVNSKLEEQGRQLLSLQQEIQHLHKKHSTTEEESKNHGEKHLHQQGIVQSLVEFREDRERIIPSSCHEVVLPPSVYSEMALTSARFFASEVSCVKLLFSLVVTVLVIVMQLTMVAILFNISINDEEQLSTIVTPYSPSIANSGYSPASWWVKSARDASALQATCLGQTWSYHSAEMQKYMRYNGGMEVFGSTVGVEMGRIMGCVTLILWLGIVLKHLVHFCESLLLCLVQGPPFTVSETPPKCFHTKSLHLSYIGVQAKVIIVTFAMLRLIVLVGVGLMGAKFLIYSSDVRDFLLNFLACAVILYADEIALRVFFAPIEWRNVMFMKPIQVHSGGLKIVFQGCGTPLFLLVIIGVTAAFVAVYLDPYSEDLKKVVKIMNCSQHPSYP